MTRDQRATLDFIARFQRNYGIAPSYREIAAALGVASTGTIHGLVHRLEAMGLLRRSPGHSRSWEVVPQVTVEEIAEAIAEQASGGGRELASAIGIEGAAKSILADKLPNLPRRQ